MKTNPAENLTKWIESAQKAMEENTKKEWPTCDLNWQRLGADFGPTLYTPMGRFSKVSR